MTDKIAIHPTARISEHATIRGAGQIHLGAYVKIEEGVTIDTSDNPSSKLTIGPRSKVKNGFCAKDIRR